MMAEMQTVMVKLMRLQMGKRMLLGDLDQLVILQWQVPRGGRKTRG